MTAEALDPDEAVAALGALLFERRAALKKPVSIAIALTDHGAYCLDGRDPNGGVQRGWSDTAELAVVTNKKTISDLVRGRFNPSAPEPNHLFLFSGDEQIWRELAGVLGGGGSIISARVGRKKGI